MGRHLEGAQFQQAQPACGGVWRIHFVDTARSYLDHIKNPEYLRYYYAAKLNSSMEDIDLSLDDFVARVNSDLVGKYINIASRTAGFIAKHFDGRLFGTAMVGYDSSPHLSPDDMQPVIIQRLRNEAAQIRKHYESRSFSAAIVAIMKLADVANEYISDKAPWKMAKNLDEDFQKIALQRECSVALELFRILTIYLKPVLPKLATEVENFLNISPLIWSDINKDISDGHVINQFSHLITRIDPQAIEAMTEANKENLAPTPTLIKTASTATLPVLATSDVSEAEYITIDDFTKVDLRIAKIVNAEHVEGADKLLKLTLDIGEETTRQVFAGIKSAYDPATLIGRNTVMVANLAPRKMKFGMSEGMVLAASDENGGPFILSPDDGAKAGMRIK